MSRFVCTDREETVGPAIPKDGATMLILTSAPNKEEAYAGQMNRGRAKKKLRQMLKRAGIPEDQVAYAPIVCWRPKKDREPTAREMEACRAHLRELIDTLSPNIIVAMGAPAIEGSHEALSLYFHRGDLHKSKVFRRKWMGTYAPGYPFINWDAQQVIENDLRKAWSTAHTDKWPLRLGRDYYVVTTVEEAERARDYLLSRPRMSFDIETEGFKLWGDDEILCVSFSTRKGEGYVFPLRGAWSRHEEDYYPDWQLERGEWGFTKGGQTELGEEVPPRRVLFDKATIGKLGKTGRPLKPKVLRPAFRAGSVICETPDAHDPASLTFAKHICRGTLTDVLGGKLREYTGDGQMKGKMVPGDYIKFVGILRDILESDVPKIAQNGKFDVHGLRYQLDIRVRKFNYDTILVHHLFHEESPHDLEFIRSQYTWMPRYNEELKEWVPTKKHSFALVPNEVLWEYSAADADCEFRVADPLWEQLLADNPEDAPWLFENVAMPLQRALTQIEEHGMLVDRARLDELSDMYRRKIEELRAKLTVLCDAHKLSEPDKWTSDDQLRKWFFNTQYEIVVKKPTKTQPGVTRIMRGVGFPPEIAVKTKKKEDSTGKKTLAALRRWCREEVRYTKKELKGKIIRRPTDTPLSDKERARRKWMLEVINAVEGLKKCIKAKNQFLDGDDEKKTPGAKALLAHIRPDGRIHSNYNLLVETGRLSSTDPNLQNISNTSEDKEYRHMGIRSMFWVPEDCDFISADYNSEEVRIIARLAEEPVLNRELHTCGGFEAAGGKTCGEVFLPTKDDPNRPLAMAEHLRKTGHKARDIHKAVASWVYRVPITQVTSEMRRKCKSVTFGLGYGQSEVGLAEGQGISVAEAKEVMDLYFKAFPRLEKYRGEVYAAVARGEDIYNAFGRTRHSFGVREMKGYVDDWEYRKVISAKQRERLNFPTQSTAGDVLSLDTIALADVWGVMDGEITVAHRLGKELCGEYPALLLRDYNTRTINTCHDALEFEGPKKYAKEVDEIIEKVMVGIPWKVLGWYLPVEISRSDRWEEDPDDDEDEAKAA